MENLDIKFNLPLEALEETQLSSTPIFDGKVLHVKLDEGTVRERDLVEFYVQYLSVEYRS